MIETTKIIQALADKFAEGLKDDIGEENFAEVIRRNNDPEGPYSINGSCASHDFCDANMTMWQAFVDVIGRDPCFGDEAPGSQLDLAIVNDAWRDASIRHIGGLDRSDDPRFSPAGRKLRAAGFSVWDTGGGCKAWGRREGDKHVLITFGDDGLGLGDEPGNEAESGMTNGWLACLYDEDDGESIEDCPVYDLAGCITWSVDKLTA